MKQRTAILVATGLTIFVVILVGAVGMALTARTIVPETNIPAELVEQSLSGDALIAPGVSPESSTSTPAPPAAQPALISATRAVEVAMEVMPGSRAERIPELVNFQGKMAYEVALVNGLVYVDAFTGLVLSSASTTISSDPTVNPGASQGEVNNSVSDSDVSSQNANANDNTIVGANANANANDNDNDNDNDNNNDNGDDNLNDNDDDDDDHRHGGGDRQDDDRDSDDDNSGKGSGNSGKGSGNSGKGGGDDD